MSKRQKFWLGLGLLVSVVIGFFALAWAAEGLMYAIELFAAMGIICAVAFMIITGITLMMDSRN